jgi:hypothetical protein
MPSVDLGERELVAERDHHLPALVLLVEPRRARVQNGSFIVDKQDALLRRGRAACR